jgi:hypothetical protein
VHKDDATRSRKKLHDEAARGGEGETRSPGFTERTRRRKLGAAGNLLATTLLAYGRERLSGMTERLKSPADTQAGTQTGGGS